MEHREGKKAGFLPLCIGAVGVVYGDVGTSPLYTIKEIFNGPHALPVTPANVLGVLSLIFWALMTVISLKYISFIMRADNRGEGGIMALIALALRHRHRRWQRNLIGMIGLFGTALFYGDGLITPAISVLSAVEGLEVAAPALAHFVVPIAVCVLFGLFYIQSKGTAKVGAFFGPVMIVWFGCLFILGWNSLQQDERVWQALDPRFGLHFFMVNRWQGFLALGAVVLAITGAEALYADMGHFGRNPIRASWFVLVFPALIVNYLGQGALILRNPEAIQNPFYLLVPPWAMYPMIGLSTLATVIASQAVISGAFSITRQAVQLDYLPRQKMVHTSTSEIGQIFVPTVNTLLMIGVIGLVVGFGSSSNLASAYGIAVTGAMTIDTLLASVIALDVWHWRPALVATLMGFFALVDLAFLSANIPKIPTRWLVSLVDGRICLFDHACLEARAGTFDAAFAAGRHFAHRVPGKHTQHAAHARTRNRCLHDIEASQPAVSAAAEFCEQQDLARERHSDDGQRGRCALSIFRVETGCGRPGAGFLPHHGELRLHAASGHSAGAEPGGEARLARRLVRGGLLYREGVTDSKSGDGHEPLAGALVHLHVSQCREPSFLFQDSYRERHGVGRLGGDLSDCFHVFAPFRYENRPWFPPFGLFSAEGCEARRGLREPGRDDSQIPGDQ